MSMSTTINHLIIMTLTMEVTIGIQTIIHLLSIMIFITMPLQELLKIRKLHHITLIISLSHMMSIMIILKDLISIKKVIL